MKRCAKYVLTLVCAVFLMFSMKTTAQAAEVAAPFTADFLIQVVNAQAANVSSVREVISEAVIMTESSTGITISANLAVDAQRNRTTSHTVTSMSMSAAGYTSAASQESYSVIANGIESTFTYNSGTGKWTPYYEALTAQELASAANPFALTGIAAAGVPVTTDGTVFKFTAALDAASMAVMAESLTSAGVDISNGSFPVEVVVDAATLLPKSMTIYMTGLTMPDMPGVTASAAAVVNFSEYNMYNNLTIPADVLAKVG
ncbi:MAG: hypothetical protein IJ390_04060 [Lachnospiraceae bacterium]|nr:hypothetical protein [Lachnospiraceae bacterium]